jgi:hypothetical protein
MHSTVVGPIAADGVQGQIHPGCIEPGADPTHRLFPVESLPQRRKLDQAKRLRRADVPHVGMTKKVGLHLSATLQRG